MWQIIQSEKRDWDDLHKSFQWIKDMEGVPQDSVFHAEGDVAAHTRMVVGALLAQPEYKALEVQEQEILYAATLLHDVEKRSTTVVDEAGRIRSPKHAKKGEYTARRLVYKLKKTPFVIKEQIAKLVRYHGLPLWVFEKSNPKRALYQASLEVDTHLLYILAKADVYGRICEDQANLLYKVDLFKEFCIEQDCYGKAKDFGSNWGRYTYFQKEEISTDYIPFEKNAFEVIVMSALPGSGKDTFIQNNYPDLAMVSIDALRRKKGISPKDKKGTGQMVQLAKEQARVHLRKKESFVWNATNITRSIRKQVVDLFQSYGAKTKIVYLEVPYTDLLLRNKKREHQVPVNVLRKMIRNLEVPALWEAPEVVYYCD